MKKTAKGKPSAEIRYYLRIHRRGMSNFNLHRKKSKEAAYEAYESLLAGDQFKSLQGAEVAVVKQVTITEVLDIGTTKVVPE